MTLKDSKTQYCCSKFPWTRKRIYPKIIDSLGNALSKWFACRGLEGPSDAAERLVIAGTLSEMCEPCNSRMQFRCSTTEQTYSVP